MSELIPINIVIADRSYRLRIEAGDEEMVRKTALLINDKITEYRKNLAGKDMQDYVAMVLLWFATERNRTVEDPIQWKETEARLLALEKMIDRSLTP